VSSVGEAMSRVLMTFAAFKIWNATGHDVLSSGTGNTFSESLPMSSDRSMFGDCEEEREVWESYGVLMAAEGRRDQTVLS
jgi:hypothetical protein